MFVGPVNIGDENFSTSLSTLYSIGFIRKNRRRIADRVRRVDIIDSRWTGRCYRIIRRRILPCIRLYHRMLSNMSVSCGKADNLSGQSHEERV